MQVARVAIHRDSQDALHTSVYGKGLVYNTLKDVEASLLGGDNKVKLIADIPLKIGEPHQKLWNILLALQEFGDDDATVSLLLTDFSEQIFRVAFDLSHESK